MPRFTRCVALAALVAGLVAAGGGFTAAQNAKTKAPAKDVGTVEITKDKGGQFRFKVVGTDAKAIVQSSKGYASKDDALKAIEDVKTILSKGKVVEGK